MKTAICARCVNSKITEKDCFPIMCAKLKLPCLAIRPEIMDDSQKREQMVRANVNGIAYDDFSVLDREFIAKLAAVGRTEVNKQ